LLRVYIEGPIDNSVNLRASTSNKARKPLKSVENSQVPMQEARGLTKKESNENEDEEKFSLLDREESDDSFFSENEDNFIKESDVNEKNNNSKENINPNKRKKSARLKTKRALDEREKVVSTACLIM
jgi:hypothetical protein